MFGYFRDVLINTLPFKKLPPFLTKSIYGFKPDFIFLIHPRRIEDIFIAKPFLRFISRLVPPFVFRKITSLSPAYVVGKAETKEGLRGFIVTNGVTPEYMIGNKRATIYCVKKILNFIRKISNKNCYVGLGAWWPIVTRRGLVFKKYADKNTCITNGHCGTLISIFLSIKKIAKIWNMDMTKLDIVIIGSGKMGSTVAKALLGHVRKISMLDKNKAKLINTKKMLEKNGKTTVIETHHVTPGINIKDILSAHHLGVCSTSNINPILKSFEIPDHFIMLDDSRPEAIFRSSSEESGIVLEGGLIKIKDIKVDYDFGFGLDENVFGCLAEAIILALDKEKRLTPSIGDVDFDNFHRMLEFCSERSIQEGDFKRGIVNVPEEKIRASSKVFSEEAL